MKEFACGSVVPGCSAVFQAEDDNGILALVAQHARADHAMKDVPDEVVAQVRGNIRTV